MKYIIDETLVNALLNYLAKRPYIEVANLIQGMNGMLVYEKEAPQENSTSETVPCNKT